MSVAYRLFGDRNVAASLRGEAKRVLFLLDQQLSNLDISFGRMVRSYPDGSTISVRRIFGMDIVEITGVGGQEELQPVTIEIYFIMVYWGPSNKKFYSATLQEGRITVAECSSPIAVNILNAYNKPAPLILNDFSLSRHVVNYGATRDNWIKIPGHTGGMRDYTDRFWYRMGTYSDGGDNRPFAYRQIKDFLEDYSTQTAFFPKQTGDVVAWQELSHGSYGGFSNIKGPFNFTLQSNPQGIERATSWGQRIHILGYAPEDVIIGGVSYGHMYDYPGYVAEGAYDWVSYFTWPVITTAWVRKGPIIYCLQYETDAGTQTTGALLTDSLKFRADSAPGYMSAQTLSHWPFAALYGGKLLYMKNQHDFTYDSEVTGPPWNGTSQTIDTNWTIEENLAQELRAGDRSLALASSKFLFNYFSQMVRTNPSGIGHDPTFAVTDTSLSLIADYGFLDLLAFSQFKDSIFCFLKKTSVHLEIFKTRHTETWTNHDPNIVVTDTLLYSVKATKKVDYTFVAPTKTLQLASFQQTMNATADASGILTGSQDGSGTRIHGVSCQANPNLCVFSCTIEEFTGLGSEASDYYFWFPLEYTFAHGPWNHWRDSIPVQESLFSIASFKIPYPFPLEDQNTSLRGAQLWRNQKLMVGAVRNDIEGHGLFTFAENPGSVGQVKKTLSL